MDTIKLTHGGDWAGFEIEYGRKPLDFSMNVNPLGIPEAVRQAIAEAAAEADRYPDPLCRKLREAISLREEVPAEWIFCGNGAADIIFRLAQALKPEEMMPMRKLLVTAPTFSEYETAFSEAGWNVSRHFLKEKDGFRITDRILEKIDRETDAVFLCEPNNPTGVTTDRKLLQEILRRCAEVGAYLVIDECFGGFLDEPYRHTMKADLETGRQLVILKAFTKLYGMAGVRLGYCLCPDQKLHERLRNAGAPWNVSSLAQAAGIAALENRQHAEEGARIVSLERLRLRKELEEIGISPAYGEANYLLFHSRPGLDALLREKGILIRNCGSYAGLEEGWYRIAVKRPEENRILIRALREALEALRDEETPDRGTPDREPSAERETEGNGESDR